MKLTGIKTDSKSNGECSYKRQQKMSGHKEVSRDGGKMEPTSSGFPGPLETRGKEGSPSSEALEKVHP